jgi:hypothetical protein
MLNMRLSPRRNRPRAGRGRAADRRFRPDVGVAALEDRRLLSTVTVSTNKDIVDGMTTSIADLIANPGPDGAISLREAVIAADNSTGDNEIDLKATTYTLTASTLPFGENDPRFGDLDVYGHGPNQTLTIKGAGSGKTIITSDVDRIFSFNPPYFRAGDNTQIAVVLSGMTLTGQNPSLSATNQDYAGGAFDFRGSSLTMTDVDVTGSTAVNGGGIALFPSDGGLVTIADSTFYRDFAMYGTATSDPAPRSNGGAIYIEGSGAVSISNTTITQNMTYWAPAVMPDRSVVPFGHPGNGGGIYDAGGAGSDLELHGVLVQTNATGQFGGPSDLDGGGVYTLSDTLTIDQGSVFSTNGALRHGGGLYTGSASATISNASIVTNGVQTSFNGPPRADDIYAGAGAATIRNSRVAYAFMNAGTPNTLIDTAPGATVDAANNWFGSNVPDPTLFGAGVTFAPNLIADVSAPKTDLAVGESVKVTFAITRNSLGLSGFSVPDGSPVSFAATHGTISPTTVGTVGGTATATFTPAAGYVGPASASAILDGGGNAIGFTVGNPQAAPKVTTQPQSQQLRVGQTVTFTAAASGNPTPTVQWQVSTNFGQTFADISGATSTTYSFRVAPADNNKMFRAVFTNSLGKATTGSALLTLALASVTGISVTGGPAGQVFPLLTQADGVRILPAGRHVDVPWLGLNVIGIGLDNLVGIAPSDIKVNGINVVDYGPVKISQVSFSPIVYALTLARPIDGPDRVTIQIDSPAVTPFTRRLDVLPGDVNDDGAVTIADAISVRDHLQSFGGVYLGWADVDGNGVIDLTDMNTVRKRIGQVLP